MASRHLISISDKTYKYAMMKAMPIYIEQGIKKGEIRKASWDKFWDHVQHYYVEN